MVKGSGRPNFLVMSLKVRNQEDFYVECLKAEKRTCLPFRLRIFLGPSLAIISRALSIRNVGAEYLKHAGYQQGT